MQKVNAKKELESLLATRTYKAYMSKQSAKINRAVIKKLKREFGITIKKYNELADLADKFFPKFNNPKADE